MIAAGIAKKRERERAERIEERLRTQRQVSFQLILGGLVFFAFIALAAYITIKPRGHLNETSIRPMLEAYMTAGKEESGYGAHTPLFENLSQ